MKEPKKYLTETKLPALREVVSNLSDIAKFSSDKIRLLETTDISLTDIGECELQIEIAELKNKVIDTKNQIIAKERVIHEYAEKIERDKVRFDAIGSSYNKDGKQVIKEAKKLTESPSLSLVEKRYLEHSIKSLTEAKYRDVFLMTYESILTTVNKHKVVNLKVSK
jgi:hypothetical protein